MSKKFVFAASAMIFTNSAYRGYKDSSEDSTYQKACDKLGLIGNMGLKQTSRTQYQDAILKHLQIAGYLRPQNIWRDINKIGIEKPEILFKELYKIVKKTNADSENPSDFNAKLFRKNFGKNSHITESEMMDLLLCMSQHAYEKSQFKKIEEFKENASILGLIERRDPSYKEYEAVWIVGGSRPALIKRLIDFNYNIEKYHININGDIIIFADEVPISANATGINPNLLAFLNKAFEEKKALDSVKTISSNEIEALEEGKEYILSLAKTNNIKYNELVPFIKFNSKDECPDGYLSNRFYINYDKSETKKLTQKLMCEDLHKTYLSTASKLLITDTLLGKSNGHLTSPNVKAASRKFVEDILSKKYGDKKEFLILIQSFNPILEPAIIIAQREVETAIKDKGLDNEIYKIRIDGACSASEADFFEVNRAFGAIISAKWKNAIANDRENTHKPFESLSFHRGQKDNSKIPEQPIIQDEIFENTMFDIFDRNPFQKLFDYYLE
ncbi:MAG: hypothetical protein SFT68_03075 [Rickettsiaceae bacterium]|nr:hypothetical protein [Rickettsiaceae bacterium]